jgi:hypothetical protein
MFPFLSGQRLFWARALSIVMIGAGIGFVGHYFQYEVIKKQALPPVLLKTGENSSTH